MRFVIAELDNNKAMISLQDRIVKTIREDSGTLTLLSYYRRFIPKSSIIASPLYELFTSNESQVQRQY